MKNYFSWFRIDNQKTEFMSSIAHQLKTQITGVSWTLNMFLKGDFGVVVDEQKVHLKQSLESLNRMIKIVNDIIQADKIGLNTLDLIFKPTQIMDLIDSVISDEIDVAKQKNITIKVDNNQKEIPLINADPDRIREVIQNLVENAIKYTNEDGVITLKVACEDTNLKVSVSDNGIGIPEKEQHYIFNRFFRATNVRKVETSGTGLGLFIVKGIIEKHGGTIVFDSKEGAGATFTFTLKAIR